MDGSFLDKVREVSRLFFDLSAEEKKKYLREEEDLEGYGKLEMTWFSQITKLLIGQTGFISLFFLKINKGFSFGLKIPSMVASAIDKDERFGEDDDECAML
ncbi:putative non-heme dioxygenase domain-containing protein [Helianthus annuus]|nr:putative non-heme dioxygenase domain-containing protein [Helianthus annuus]